MKSSPMTDGEKASVILVGYNCVAYLDRCLASLIESDYPNFETIYVDNCSDDGSPEYVEEHFGKQVLTLRLDRNYGFSVACNVGARHSDGEYLVFLNVDTIVRRDWLTELISALESDRTIGAAQSKLLQIDGKTIDSLGGFITPYGTVWSKGHGSSDGSSSRIEEIFYSKGAAMITRRDIWKRLGEFDPLYFLYFQETDYCWRLWSSGYRVVCVPSSVVLHVGGGVTARTPRLVKFHEARERVILLVKNHTWRNLIRYLPVTVFLQVLNAVRHLLVGDPATATSVLEGTIAGVLEINSVWRSRKRVLSLGERDMVAVSKVMLRQIWWTLR
jgi:GT2 family glycosyltransferase